MPAAIPKASIGMLGKVGKGHVKDEGSALWLRQ